MMPRILGLGLLLASAFWCSLRLIRGANLRLSQTEGLCALIRYVRNNIDSFMTPIGGILSSFDGYGDSLSDFMEAAREKGLSYGTEHAALAIGERGMSILREFTTKVGTGYKEDEIRLCDYCLRAMEELLEEERVDVGKRMKMYKTLPVMSALSIGLLLL